MKDMLKGSEGICQDLFDPFGLFQPTNIEHHQHQLQPGLPLLRPQAVGKLRKVADDAVTRRCSFGEAYFHDTSSY